MISISKIVSLKKLLGFGLAIYLVMPCVDAMNNDTLVNKIPRDSIKKLQCSNTMSYENNVSKEPRNNIRKINNNMMLHPNNISKEPQDNVIQKIINNQNKIMNEQQKIKYETILAMQKIKNELIDCILSIRNDIDRNTDERILYLAQRINDCIIQNKRNCYLLQQLMNKNNNNMHKRISDYTLGTMKYIVGSTIEIQKDIYDNKINANEKFSSILNSINESLY